MDETPTPSTMSVPKRLIRITQLIVRAGFELDKDLNMHVNAKGQRINPSVLEEMANKMTLTDMRIHIRDKMGVRV